MGIQPRNKFTIPQPEQWQGRSSSKNCQKHAEESEPRQPRHEPSNANTPTGGGNDSPAQKLQSRRTRTQLPMATELLQPEIPKGIEEEIQSRRQKAKQQYDRTAKELLALAVGQAVRIQPLKRQERWKKGIVLQKVSNRSYLVQSENGQIYRRNHKHLRHTKERPITPHTAVEESAKDELVIPFSENQQIQGNEQAEESPANQNQLSYY